MIGLEVEASGATPKKELPFAVGVLANVSGNLKNETSLRDRKAHQIDRENFSEVMAEINPRLKLEFKGKPSINLAFTSMEDFEPQKVAEGVPELKEMLQDRQMLTDLLSRLHSNGRLGDRLQQALEDYEERMRLARDLRTKPQSAP